MTTAQHPVHIAHPVATAASGIDAAMIVRRFTLFIGMLTSGGLLLFPRPLLLGLLVILCLIIKGLSLGLRREMWPIPLLLILVMAMSLYNDGFRVDVLAVRFASFGGGLMLLGLYGGLPRKTLIDDMVPITRAMSVQAMLTVALFLGAPQLFQSANVFDVVYQTVGWIFTYHVSIDDPSLIIRPDGLFYEPGVFQIYLNLFLYIALFVRRSAVDVGLALVAILCLQSTTGLLVAGGLCTAFAAQFLRGSQLRGVIVASLLLTTLALPLYFVVGANLEQKISGVFRGSTWAREYDFYTGLRIIEENPLSGIGLTPEAYREAANRHGYFESRLSNVAIAERISSNGILSLFTVIGIPLGLVFIWGLFRQPFFEHRLLIGGLLVLSLLSETLVLTPFFLMLSFGGMMAFANARRRASG